MVHDHLNYVDDTLGCDAVKFELISQQSAACLDDEGSVLSQNTRCHVSGKKKHVIGISPRLCSLMLAILCCGRILTIISMVWKIYVSCAFWDQIHGFRDSVEVKKNATSCKILLRNKWNDYTNLSCHVISMILYIFNFWHQIIFVV
jgi:hypothetical protein